MCIKPLQEVFACLLCCYESAGTANSSLPWDVLKTSNMGHNDNRSHSFGGTGEGADLSKIKDLDGKLIPPLEEDAGRDNLIRDASVSEDPST